MHRPNAPSSSALARGVLAAVSGLCALAASPGTARADAVPLELVARGDNRLMVDGVLGDWRRFADLVGVDDGAQVLSGRGAWTGSDDASFSVALAQDPQALYLGAEVHDDQVVRGRDHRGNDDALVLSLAVTVGGHPVGYDIKIYPGEPGSYPGVVRFAGARSGAITGAQVVEAPLRNGSGFTIEVAIPWRALPEIHANLASLRARVAYQDADTHANPTVDTLIATGPGDGQHPGELPPAAGSTGAVAQDLLARFREQMGLTATEPLLDRSANIAGDAALERVVVFPHYLLAFGPGIAGGTRYSYSELPTARQEDVLEPALRDVTGDGRMDVVLRLRLPSDHGLVREVLYVYGAPNGADQLSRLFAHELGRSQGNNSVADRATYESGPRIRITAAGGQGYTEATYPRLVEQGTTPPLTPWSENRVELWRWNEQGQRFELGGSEPNPNATVRRNEAVVVAAPNSGGMTQAPTDVDGVLRLFRQRSNLAQDARPEFSTHGNVSGDATPEAVEIYGHTLVVVGAHFMGGRSYSSIELPDNAEVLGLQLMDVTGDGRGEAMVRVRRQSEGQVRGRTLSVVRELLMVYSLDETHRGRVFAAEVARRVDNDAVVNDVRPLGGPPNQGLVIQAGRVTGGWNAQTYPFHDAPIPGFAPILLPWDANPRVTYRWNGTGLAPAQ